MQKKPSDFKIGGLFSVAKSLRCGELSAKKIAAHVGKKGAPVKQELG